LGLESYGGNPDIVATREEITRIAFELRQAAIQLSAFGPIDQLLQDPLRQLQFRFASVGIYQKLERLYVNCNLAAESYFTTEAQIHRRFEVTVIPQLAKLFSVMGLAWQREPEVSAEAVAQSRIRPPQNMTEMLNRLWRLSSNPEARVGVDSFEVDGKKLAIVYIPGTQSMEFGGGTNPLDMTSNIQAMAGSKVAASERAVIEAIKNAGITEADEVILVGHSQGGMVAGNLAAAPLGFSAIGLITFGAPVAQLSIKNIPVMAIEHKNDFIPNLSGRANPLQRNWVTVQREAKASESDALLSSHSLKSYQNTTVLIDQSGDQGIANIRSQLLEKLANANSGVATDYKILKAKGF
jgi:hypothetical protein